MGETVAAFLLVGFFCGAAGLAIGMHLREYLLVRLRGWEWHVLPDGKVLVIPHRDLSEAEVTRLKHGLEQTLSAQRPLRIAARRQKARG